MRMIDTCAIAAKVVKFKPVRYFAYMQFIRDAVGLQLLCATIYLDADLTIAPRIFSAFPLPTAGDRINRVSVTQPIL